MLAKTFLDNGDGTVTDTATGLTWMRCSVGQTWTGSTCSGTAGSFTWDQANALTGTVTFAGQSDWHLPSLDEIRNIVDLSYYPSIDPTVFPNTLSTNFWSASAYPENLSYAYLINLNDGANNYFYWKTLTYAARLVRTGLPSSKSLSFLVGWNLLGNGSATQIDVAATFSDTNRFISVWKWVAPQSSWAFYAPALAAQGGTTLEDFVASKGYLSLTSIAGGEGFWVNIKEAGSIDQPSGAVVTNATLATTLVQGWNLAAIGEALTPKQFSDALSGGVTTLWAWDNSRLQWYFYAPSLETQGGTVLTDYITSHGYQDFSTANKWLETGVGFWVNKP